MRSNEKTRIILFTTIGVLIGSALPFLNVVTTLFLLLFFMLLAFSSMVLMVYALFASMRLLKWGFIGLVPIFIGFGLFTVISTIKHNKAEALNTQLKNYRKEHGRYPLSLTELSEPINLNGLIYEPDTGKQQYRFEYLINNFSREYYDSKANEWGTLGWND